MAVSELGHWPDRMSIQRPDKLLNEKIKEEFKRCIVDIIGQV